MKNIINKLLPLGLVVILSGCASNNGTPIEGDTAINMVRNMEEQAYAQVLALKNLKNEISFYQEVRIDGEEEIVDVKSVSGYDAKALAVQVQIIDTNALNTKNQYLINSASYVKDNFIYNVDYIRKQYIKAPFDTTTSKDEKEGAFIEYNADLVGSVFAFAANHELATQYLMHINEDVPDDETVIESTKTFSSKGDGHVYAKGTLKANEEGVNESYVTEVEISNYLLTKLNYSYIAKQDKNYLENKQSLTNKINGFKFIYPNLDEFTDIQK